MIANIQGYHVSVVTLVLSFFPPPSSLQAKLSPHSAAPHQCRIASYKATAPDLHLYCCTAQGLHHSSGLTSEPAVPTQRCGSCRVLWLGTTLCHSGCPSPVRLHQHLLPVMDRMQLSRPALPKPQPSYIWQVRGGDKWADECQDIPLTPGHHWESIWEIRCNATALQKAQCPPAWLKGMFLLHVSQLVWHRIGSGCGHRDREAKLKA